MAVFEHVVEGRAPPVLRGIALVGRTIFESFAFVGLGIGPAKSAPLEDRVQRIDEDEPARQVEALGAAALAKAAQQIVFGQAGETLADQPVHQTQARREFHAIMPRNRVGRKSLQEGMRLGLGQGRKAEHRSFAKERHAFAISRRDAPEVCHQFPSPLIRGRREAGRPMRPIAACATVVVERTRVSQVTPESPGTPRAMVYGLYVISPVSPALLPPSPARLERELDTSLGVSGPHDFAVRFSRPRQEHHPRPPHPRPALVTLRNAPPNGTGWRLI